MSTKKVMVAVELKLLKTKSGKVCAMAQIDMGYRQFPITWDETCICELFNLSMRQLYDMKTEFENELNKQGE